MLHSLPALLDELERRLVAGEDPLPLIGSVRWSEVIDWPRNREETLKIRRKLALLVGGAILQMFCLGALALWALHVVSEASVRRQSESERMLLANRVSAGMMRATTIVGHVALAESCEGCHGTAHSLNDTGQIDETRKQYLDLLARLKTLDETGEGRRMVAVQQIGVKVAYCRGAGDGHRGGAGGYIGL